MPLAIRTHHLQRHMDLQMYLKVKITQKNSFWIEDTQVDTEDLEGSFKMQPMQIENLLKGVKE